MFSDDYIIRNIEMMARFIAKAIFGKESVEYEIIRDKQGNISDISFLCLTLHEMVDRGEICKAENLLFSKAEESNDIAFLEVGIDFYNYLNKMEDDFLEVNNFSRQEIYDGVFDLQKLYGIAYVD